MVQQKEWLHTNIHTQRQRLERRLRLGFLLLAQRFMVGESCGESLRLNYTDREHQIQEKKTSQALGRMMGWEQRERERDMEVVYARDV